MTWIRFVLMYFFMVAHKGACHVEGLLEVYEDMVEVFPFHNAFQDVCSQT